jgi:hypothetical protein
MNIIIMASMISCLIFSSGCNDDYFGVVVAHIEPRPIDAIRRAVFTIDDFKYATRIKMRNANPDCEYYSLSSQTPKKQQIGITECFGVTNSSETGWGYWVSIISGERDSPEIQKEVTRLLEAIRKTVQVEVGDAKVTVRIIR